jgi:hypothetical protein
LKTSLYSLPNNFEESSRNWPSQFLRILIRRSYPKLATTYGSLWRCVLLLNIIWMKCILLLKCFIVLFVPFCTISLLIFVILHYYLWIFHFRIYPQSCKQWYRVICLCYGISKGRSCSKTSKRCSMNTVTIGAAMRARAHTHTHTVCNVFNEEGISKDKEE